MKRLGKIAVCLAGGLALNAGLRAAGPAAADNSANNPLPDNPYAAIAIRNIFGLNPPVVVTNDPNALLEASLPKITPTGIMGVFGNWQVLLKVAPPAKPGPPAKDEYYILSEGQRQDDIEVIKIDEKRSLVTFDNHGFTQELPLANPSASGGAPSGPSSPGGMNPGMTPRPAGGGGNSGPGGLTRFGAGPGGNNGGTGNGTAGFNNGAGNSANNGTDFGNSTQGRTYQPPQDVPQMTRQESETLIELQRAALLSDPHPKYPPSILPPTSLTPFNTTDGN
jgi:hypothetical protein